MSEYDLHPEDCEKADREIERLKQELKWAEENYTLALAENSLLKASAEYFQGALEGAIEEEKTPETIKVWAKLVLALNPFKTPPQAPATSSGSEDPRAKAEAAYERTKEMQKLNQVIEHAGAADRPDNPQCNACVYCRGEGCGSCGCPENPHYDCYKCPIGK